MVENYPEQMSTANIILTSNIKTLANENEKILNFNTLSKLGWKYFDNSTIMCLRMLAKIGTLKIAFAGFDGFKENEDVVYFINNIT